MGKVVENQQFNRLAGIRHLRSMRFDKARNPFKPGYGKVPPELAGRDSIKASFEREIDCLRRGEPETGSFALIGPRGCGKTALLYWLRMRAARASIQVVELGPDNLASEDALAGALSSPGGVLSGALRVGGPVSNELGGIGTTAEPGRSSKGTGHPGILKLLESKASKKPLILIVDEVHELNLEVAHNLFRSFQTAASQRPMLLACAGTPDTEIHLRNAKVAFVERQAVVSVGLLDEEFSFQALAKPLTAGGVDFDEAALRRASSEAQNYPYFLQCWGDALWNALPEGKPINSGDQGWSWYSNLFPYKPRLERMEFNAAKEEATKKCQRLYARRILEFERYGLVAPAAELALRLNAGDDPSVAVEMFSTNLADRWQMSGTRPPRGIPQDNLTQSARQLLLHTGFVWEPEPGSWEFGIPSLAGHIARSAATTLAAKMTMQHGVSAFRAVLEFAGRTERTHDEVVDHLVKNGKADDTGHANRILRPLEQDGLLGPVGRLDSNGHNFLLVLTPRLAGAVIEEMKHMPEPAHSLTPFDELTT